MKGNFRTGPPPKVYIAPKKTVIKWRDSIYEVFKILITVTPAIIVAFFTYKISQNAGLFDLKNERLALEKQMLELSKQTLEIEIAGFEKIKSGLLSTMDSIRIELVKGDAAMKRQTEITLSLNDFIVRQNKTIEQQKQKLAVLTDSATNLIESGRTLGNLEIMHGPTRGWGVQIAQQNSLIQYYRLKDLTRAALQAFPSIPRNEITQQPGFKELPEYKKVLQAWKMGRYNEHGYEREPTQEELEGILNGIIRSVKDDLEGNYSPPLGM